jgi:hypothetical protein
MFDLIAYLKRQQTFSEATFGPGTRTKGILDHIRKELKEVENDPFDPEEWLDVATLALDGAWRCGATAEQIAQLLEEKLVRNENRIWPDWRTMSPDVAIEHDRS